MRKCKDTLTSLQLNDCEEIDLSPLKNSKALTHLAIENCSQANMEVISTFQNLQELVTDNQYLLQRAITMKSLKSLILHEIYSQFPPSLQCINFKLAIDTAWIKRILDNHPQIKEVTLIIPSNRHHVALLLKEYKNVKFNFTKNFSMDQTTTFEYDFQLLFSQEQQELDQ
ncbi:hypothetical protein FGO68_gene3679 [Halteria grandinella]|uniref:Uncharacterized protein n=1 Tax=Halteria grandinella TaxID=5974 RepID=A0A8J8NV18_HALGN|nr:hypothetical protein FGO68_gene3679 [Halteria grandinella]